MGKPSPSGYSGVSSPGPASQHSKHPLTPGSSKKKRWQACQPPTSAHLSTPAQTPWHQKPLPRAMWRPSGEQQPPAVPSWAGQVPLCSSLRQPNMPNQRVWEGGDPPSCHPQGQRAQSPWLLMPTGRTGFNPGLWEGQDRCLDQKWGAAEPRQEDLILSSNGLQHTAAPTPGQRPEARGRRFG